MTQSQQLDAVVAFVQDAMRQRYDELVALSAEQRHQRILEEVHRSFYDNYSLWDADFDIVEQIVQRYSALPTPRA